jgi:hypothetical protein
LAVDATSLGHYLRLGYAKRVHALTNDGNRLINRFSSHGAVSAIHSRLKYDAGTALKIQAETNLGRSLEKYDRGASYQDDQKGD